MENNKWHDSIGLYLRNVVDECGSLIDVDEWG
jgi:hypothetical protein